MVGSMRLSEAWVQRNGSLEMLFGLGLPPIIPEE